MQINIVGMKRKKLLMCSEYFSYDKDFYIYLA